jgi:hypothetical protein
MKLLVLILTMLLQSPAFAQDEAASSSEKGPKPRWELGLFTGTLLLANIPEVIDNVPPFVVKIANRSQIGIVEASVLHARGNDMRWRSGILSYRFDLDDLSVPFHALIGLHMDAYQIYDGEQEFYGGGWHYGGGVHVDILPNLLLRADFVNRFGPGRSLLVIVGISVGFGSFEPNSQ